LENLEVKRVAEAIDQLLPQPAKEARP
jgi:hypothetical protein